MNVTITGVPELNKALAAVSREAVQAADRGLQRAGLHIVADAQENLRKNNTNTTGRLSQTGKVQRSREAGGGWDAGFMAGEKNYAGAVEYGRRPGRIPPPDEMAAWAYKKLRLRDWKKARAIGGLSMGGFGALHTGLKYPETFGGIMALSSALIIYHLKDMKPDMKDPVMANYEYYVNAFGDLQKAERSDHNPEVLFKRNKKNGIKNPKIYMACGTEDFLLEPNHMLRDFLKKQKADFLYEEGPGIHDWNFWTPHAYTGIEYLLNHK